MTRPVWVLLVVGAVVQAAVELVAPGPPALRVTGACLVAAVLLANTVGPARRRTVVSAAALLLGAPLWVTHGFAAVRLYGAGEPATGVVAPALLVIGTALLRLSQGTHADN